MCHVSCVTCPMSCVTCHMSHVPFLFNFLKIIFFFGKIRRWIVCYQLGLPWFFFCIFLFLRDIQLETWNNCFNPLPLPCHCSPDLYNKNGSIQLQNCLIRHKSKISMVILLKVPSKRVGQRAFFSVDLMSPVLIPVSSAYGRHWVFWPMRIVSPFIWKNYIYIYIYFLLKGDEIKIWGKSLKV